MIRPRKEHTFEREQIKLHLNGLKSSIGAYLRARREQFGMGWKELADETGIKGRGIIRIERGQTFSVEEHQIDKLFDILKIKNGEELIGLMKNIQVFQKVIKEKRFKL